MTTKLERITHFTPAYDKRNPVPSKNYGIGCMRCFLVVKGEKGAVHFVFGTGILLEKTVEDYIKEGKANYELHSFGAFYLNKPMGYDVGYHSLTPQYEGQESRKDCEWLDGKACYGDGSAMRAEEWMKIFVAEGSEKIWSMLEEEYKSTFEK